MVRRDGHGFPVRSAEIEAQDIACWLAFKLQKPETCELQRKRRQIDRQDRTHELSLAKVEVLVAVLNALI
jgi:hypothetical protein